MEIDCPFLFGPAGALDALSSGGAKRNTVLQDWPDFCGTDLLGKLVGLWIMVAPVS